MPGEISRENYPVDPECVALARYFLKDDRPDLDPRDLSEAIQKAVEDYFFMLPETNS